MHPSPGLVSQLKTLALFVLLMLCLIACMLAALPLAPWHGEMLESLGGFGQHSGWLAALGMPGVLVGLWLQQQSSEALSESIGPRPEQDKGVLLDPASLLQLEQALGRLADGDLTPLECTTLPAAYAPLAAATEQLRQRLADSLHDFESSLDAAHGQDKDYRPELGQPGQFGRIAMKLELLRQTRQDDSALGARIAQAASTGDFSPSAEDGALTDSPAGRATIELFALLDRAFTDMTQVAGAIANGQLTERIDPTYPGQIGRVCRELNSTVLNLRETLGRIEAVVDTVADAAKNIAEGNDGLASRTQEQAASLEETASSMEEINAVVQQNAETAHSVTQFVDEATAMAEGSNATMQATRQTMAELGDSARRIESIVGVIDSLSFQTNLLALNAAVEAARAGEHGRGFAVVASEVRQLSLRSSEAAQDIRRLIAGTVEQAGTTIQSVETLGTTMEHLIATIRQINERMRDIRAASQEQATGLGQVSQAIMRIDDATQQSSSQVEEAASSTRQLYGQSRGLHNLLKEFDLGPAGERARRIHHEMPALVRQAAANIGHLWEKAIAKGLLSEEDLFDTDYQPCGDTEPPKFSTRFDTVADRILPRIQEAFLQVGNHVTYAIACDHNGYVPTHNQRYCEALTGDADYDKVHNRTKRIFSDPVGRRCGRHPLPYLLQTYRRDTGEIVHDISAPVFVNGKHWGGFRVGYKTADEV